jgi:hypothetical protein
MDQTDYVYHEPVQPTFGPLPEGQYPFQVTDVISEPYTSRNGNTVLPVKLAVGPEKVPLYDNPSAGIGKAGPYDNIASFLKCIGRNPKSGERADLSKGHLVGARGELMLKVETAQMGRLAGKPVNKVAYYIWKNADGTTRAIVKAGPDIEPDDIPF